MEGLFTHYIYLPPLTSANWSSSWHTRSSFTQKKKKILLAFRTRHKNNPLVFMLFASTDSSGMNGQVLIMVNTMPFVWNLAVNRLFMSLLEVVFCSLKWVTSSIFRFFFSLVNSMRERVLHNKWPKLWSIATAWQCNLNYCSEYPGSKRFLLSFKPLVILILTQGTGNKDRSEASSQTPQ